jgi:hypothetical protein
MVSFLRWALAAAALLSLGCKTPTVHWPDPSKQPISQGSFSEAQLRHIVERVTRARELGEKRPVSIEQLVPEKFASQLDVVLKEGSEMSDDDVRRAGGVLIGFDLVPPPDKRAGLSRMKDVLAEQVVGFYDDRRDRVFVRVAPIWTEEELLDREVTIAHEVHHALQAQHFGIELGGVSEEVSLARKALVEGDAMVAAGAYLGAEYGAPIRRTVMQMSEVLNEHFTVDDVAEREASELARALPLNREELLFPYSAGMAFVVDLYRAGGFALVDRSYGEPPLSTSHILHPEKYLAGIRPAVVSDLPLPGGHTAQATGSLGELRTAIVLSRCAERAKAAQAASGWAGDRFFTMTTASGKLVLAWLSVWEDEAAAERVGALLSGCSTPWGDNRLEDGGALAISAGAYSRRDGERVALVRGVPAADAAPLLDGLMALAVVRPDPKPVSDVAIPPRRKLPEPQAGSVRDGVHDNAWLGIRGEVRAPLRFELAKDKDDPVDILVEYEARHLVGLLVLSDRITSDEYKDKAITGIIDLFAKHTQVSLTKVGEGARKTALGDAVEQSWRDVRSTAQVNIVLVPVCNGTGSLVFVLLYNDLGGHEMLERWLQSYRFTAGPDAPMCRRLDPE